MPGARIEGAHGKRYEWRSQMVPHDQRRTERVDEAILGVYLSGTNTHRLRGALAPLLRWPLLSKDASPAWWDGCGKNFSWMRVPRQNLERRTKQ